MYKRQSWTSTPVDSWNAVAYGDGKYVATGYGRAAVSTNGTSWTEGTQEASPDQWTSITYGKGLFVAVRDVGTIGQPFVYSTDGVNWTEATGANGEYDPKGVSFGNGVFFAPGFTMENSPFKQWLMWSYDGITWTSSRDIINGFTADGQRVNTQFGTFVGDRFMYFSTRQQFPTRYPVTYARYSLTGSDTPFWTSELTLAGTDNLDLFVTGDAVRMVNEDGDVASYTPVTSTISNVGFIPAWNQSENWTGYIGVGFQGVSDLSYLFDGRIGVFANPASPGEATFTPPTPIPCSKVKVVVRNDGRTGNGSIGAASIKINGVNVGALGPSGSGSVGVIEYETSQFTSLYFSSGVTGGNGADVSAIYVDDKILVNANWSGTDPGLGTELSFASPNQDLKFFSPGDGVQDSREWNQDYVWSSGYSGLTDNSQVKSFNGNPNDCAYDSRGSYFSVTGKIVGGDVTEWRLPDDQFMINMGVVPGSGGTNPLQVTLYYTDSTSEVIGTGSHSAVTTINFTIPTGKTVQTVAFDSTESANTAYLSGLISAKVNGKELVDTGIAGDPGELVIALSTDTAANTMIVDGGTWSIGGVVTAPEKSGAGNFGGSSGVVVDVTNSNQEWISDDNRLGELFYIKPASTVNGLAIARGLAETTALPWSSSDNYIEGDFVTYVGYYWRALEANTNVIPDAENFEEWLGFGPV